MNWPNKLTVLRILLAPLFFVLYFIPNWMGGISSGGEIVVTAAVVAVFAVTEISDVMDGYIARKYKLVTDVGKVIDPFADVMSRMTYFFCFTLSGLMPAWIFLVLMYRELGATFLRMLMIRKGEAMAASVWGKAKAVTYALGGVLGMLYYALEHVPFGEARVSGAVAGLVETSALVVFVLGAVSAVLSLLSYILNALPRLKSEEG